MTDVQNTIVSNKLVHDNTINQKVYSFILLTSHIAVLDNNNDMTAKLLEKTFLRL